MAAKRGKTRIIAGKEREKNNIPAEPARPAIDLSQIKARYSAVPLPNPGEPSEGEPGEIEFIDAESLTPQELEEELDAQMEADIQGKDTGFTEEALSLFAEEDKPQKHKKRRKKRTHKRRASPQEDELDFVDFSKPRKKVQLRRGVFEKAVVASAVVLMFSILLILYYWLLIDRIEVSGNVTLERAEILTTAGINIGEHILLVNTGEAQRRLMENPMIRSARVHRVYPDKLAIDIEERTPLAAIAGGGSYAIIDEEGYVLSIQPDPGDLLEVYGMGSTGFQLSEKLGDSEDFNSAILLQMIQALYKSGVIEDMVSLDITQPLSVNLISREGYTIHVGQAEDLEEKLVNLALVLQHVKALGYTGGTIDLAVRGDPVYTPPQTAAPEETADSVLPEQTDGAVQPQEADGGTGGAANATDPSPTPSQTPESVPVQPPASTGGENFSG